MAAFFPDVLNHFLSPAFIEGVRKKYHYEEAQAYEIRLVAEKLLLLMREEAFWERRVSSGKNQHQNQTYGVIHEQVAMSLGNGVDYLQETYSEREMLSQSYMIEVLASELLLQGYAAYNRYIRENTDWHVARYHFLGSEEEFPLEMLPKKSVAFIAELTQDDKVQCGGICISCNNLNCSNRMADGGLAWK